MGPTPKYSLVYWPGLPGRGELVRLAFEYTGTPYNDVKDVKLVSSYNEQKEPIKGEGTYPFAPPVLKLEDGSIISQTPNILLYLGEELGLNGDKPIDKYIINQITLTLLDLNNEIHDTHHPIASSAYYEDQKEEALKKAADFRANRFPKFFNYFESLIKANPAGYLHGSKVTNADLTLFQIVDGLKFAYPEMMESYESKMEGVLKVYEIIKTSEGIAKYLQSGRREKYSNGIFRYYEELDGPAGKKD